jgi:hypothetical protein
MRTAISILTSATLLVHALIGCAHCNVSCVPRHTAATTCNRPAHCCHSHSEKSDAGDLPSVPCKCKLECKYKCIGLPPEEVLPVDTAAVLPLAIIQPAVSLQSLIAAETARGFEISEPPDPEAPQRLHLVYQVLQV